MGGTTMLPPMRRLCGNGLVGLAFGLIRKVHLLCSRIDCTLTAVRGFLEAHRERSGVQAGAHLGGRGHPGGRRRTLKPNGLPIRLVSE